MQGYVYIANRGDIYKIGYTRNNVKRRVRACDGVLVLTIPVKRHVYALEGALHRRFGDKRAEGPYSKREWFSLDKTDIDWLRNFATTMGSGLRDVLETHQNHNRVCIDQF